MMARIFNVTTNDNAIKIGDVTFLKINTTKRTVCFDIARLTPIQTQLALSVWQKHPLYNDVMEGDGTWEMVSGGTSFF